MTLTGLFTSPELHTQYTQRSTTPVDVCFPLHVAFTCLVPFVVAMAERRGQVPPSKREAGAVLYSLRAESKRPGGDKAAEGRDAAEDAALQYSHRARAASSEPESPRAASCVSCSTNDTEAHWVVNC